MSGKFSNPIYFWVAENLFTELEIATVKNDLDSVALCLYCDFLFSKEEFKKRVKDLISKLRESSFIPKHSIAMAVVLNLYEFKKINIEIKDRNAIVKALDGIEDINIPPKYKYQVYFFASVYKGFSSKLLKEKLEENKKELVEKKTYADLLELEFALGGDDSLQSIWQNTSSKSSTLTLEMLAKLGILFANAKDTKYLDEIIYRVEADSWEKIRKIPTPDLSLLIYEAEKLISTNLSTDELMGVIKVLKDKNTKWATLISSIEKESITVNLNKINRTGGLSVVECVWIISLLNKVEREEVYQVSEEEKKKLSKYNDMTNNKAIFLSKSSLLQYLIFTTSLSLIFIFYVYFWGMGQVLGYFDNIENLFSEKLTLGTVRDLSSPIFATLFFIGVLYKSWGVVVKEGRFNVKYAISLIKPFIRH